jgi:transcriptional regulator with XRE-family HTH domain
MCAIRSMSVAKRGVSFPVTNAWRNQVKRWLAVEGKQSGISQAEMARRVKISPATLSDLLGGRHGHSVAVPSINKMIGLPPPVAADGTIDPDDVVSSIALVTESLSAPDKERVLAFARALQQSDPKNDPEKPSN